MQIAHGKAFGNRQNESRKQVELFPANILKKRPRDKTCRRASDQAARACCRTAHTMHISLRPKRVQKAPRASGAPCRAVAKNESARVHTYIQRTHMRTPFQHHVPSSLPIHIKAVARVLLVHGTGNAAPTHTHHCFPSNDHTHTPNASATCISCAVCGGPNINSAGASCVRSRAAPRPQQSVEHRARGVRELFYCAGCVDIQQYVRYEQYAY